MCNNTNINRGLGALIYIHRYGLREAFSRWGFYSSIFWHFGFISILRLHYSLSVPIFPLFPLFWSKVL